MYVYIYVYIHTYIHKYIFTYIYTYIKPTYMCVRLGAGRVDEGCKAVSWFRCWIRFQRAVGSAYRIYGSCDRVCKGR